MQEWVRKANIAEYRRLLVDEIDQERRRILLKLLADEQAKGPLLSKAKSEE